jgi:hypothetical protein
MAPKRTRAGKTSDDAPKRNMRARKATQAKSDEHIASDDDTDTAIYPKEDREGAAQCKPNTPAKTNKHNNEPGSGPGRSQAQTAPSTPVQTAPSTQPVSDEALASDRKS